VARATPGRYAPDVPPAFHHVAIRCADLEACERFYREVLGLEVVRRWPRPEGGDRSVWVGVGDGFIALERADGGPLDTPWRSAEAGIHLVALRIAPGDRVTWERRLATLGVEIAHRTRWTIYVRDPEGNRVGLSHWPHDPEPT
jgi:catechol 2,3-dioxygenase-like lactoylglutathione lyase family enzyme